MTLDEFEADLLKEAKEFVQKWRDGNERLPDEWPLEMNDGEWWEQYLSDMTFVKENGP